MSSVVRPWVSGLRFCEQVVLLSATRNCDVITKPHPTTALTGALRYILFFPSFKSMTMPAEGSTKFMDERIPEVLPRMDGLPHHWVMHMAHACQVAGYRHPDELVAESWLSLYHQFCEQMHVYPEPKTSMLKRLHGELG